MNLLIYDNSYEPLAQIILKNKELLNIKCLWIKDFIEKAQVFDVFDKKETKLSWWIPGIGKITNLSNTFIINRLYHFKEEWFQSFHSKDRAYAKNELWAYFTFALNAFPNISEKPSCGGLAGGCYSLTHQWELVKKQIKGVNTPEYFLGPIQYLPTEWNSDIVFLTPYSFYSWKANSCDEKYKNCAFAISKPKGFPVLVFIMDDHATIFLRDEEQNPLDLVLEEKIKKLAKEIHNIFNYFVSEILFFYDGNNLCFSMIHNSPIASSRSPLFEEIVVEKLKSRLLIN